MENIEIRLLHENDIETLSHDFQKEGINRDEEYFQFCLGEMKADKRVTFVALVDDHFAGTAHFLFVSKYPQFQAAKIPEINDLVVTLNWRKHGIGKKFMETLESYAFSKGYDCIGLGVGLYKDYGSAQRLYVKRGYVPDGHGVLYDYQEIQPGEMVRLDDELNLCFTKKLAD